MSTQIGQFRGGWRRALPGARANLAHFTVDPSVLAALPPSTNLKALFPPNYDQGDEGSCVAQAWRGAWEAWQKRQGDPYVAYSSQFIYNVGRMGNGDLDYDAGMYIHDGIEVLQQYGVCLEDEFPYGYEHLTDKPSPAVFASAKKNLAFQSFQVPNSELHVRAALAAGLTVVFGATLYENFQSAAALATGIIPMPSGRILGGHAMDIQGNDIPGYESFYFVRNSWGGSVYYHGDLFMPKAYIHDTNLVDELTVVQVVT